MLNRDKKIVALKRVPLFAMLSRRDLAEVAAIADELSLAAGKELAREGERGREFFVILAGAASVEQDGQPKRELKAGDFFGEISLLTQRPRTATVTTTEPTRVLVIVDRDFNALIRRVQSVHLKLLETLAERLAPELS